MPVIGTLFIVPATNAEERHEIESVKSSGHHERQPHCGTTKPQNGDGGYSCVLRSAKPTTDVEQFVMTQEDEVENENVMTADVTLHMQLKIPVKSLDANGNSVKSTGNNDDVPDNRSSHSDCDRSVVSVDRDELIMITEPLSKMVVNEQLNGRRYEEKQASNFQIFEETIVESEVMEQHGTATPQAVEMSSLEITTDERDLVVNHSDVHMPEEAIETIEEVSIHEDVEISINGDRIANDEMVSHTPLDEPASSVPIVTPESVIGTGMEAMSIEEEFTDEHKVGMGVCVADTTGDRDSDASSTQPTEKMILQDGSELLLTSFSGIALKCHIDKMHSSVLAIAVNLNCYQNCREATS